jgi:hypothetical protein
VHVAVMDMPPILAFGISAARHGVITVEPMPVRDQQPRLERCRGDVIGLAPNRKH